MLRVADVMSATRFFSSLLQNPRNYRKSFSVFSVFSVVDIACRSRRFSRCSFYYRTEGHCLRAKPERESNSRKERSFFCLSASSVVKTSSSFIVIVIFMQIPQIQQNTFFGCFRLFGHFRNLQNSFCVFRS